MEAVLIIPARYGSSRLPGKPLLDIHGSPLIVHVLRQAQKTTCFSKIIVATDDVRIVDVVQQAGGQAVLTSAAHPSGTDRVAEIAESLTADLIVNLQGDEPLVEPIDLDRLAQVLLLDPSVEMATLKRPIIYFSDWVDPHIVKVVTDERQDALYFSRAPIPYSFPAYSKEEMPRVAYRHIGVYAFRRHFLFAFASHRRTALEEQESLEQLRALDMGAKIRVIDAQTQGVGVDTQEDLERVRKIIPS